MIEAAGQLGWAYYTGTIQALASMRWPIAVWALDEENLHVACADPLLLKGASRRRFSLAGHSPFRVARLPGSRRA